MRRPLGLFLAFCFLLGFSSLALAKGAAENGLQERVQFMDLSNTADDARRLADGVLGATSSAGGATTYYGGTTWDPVDGRWEALIDSCWTFDSGVATEIIVGSAADYPEVNPFKSVGLHAYMEGWIGFDKSYSDVEFFRLLDDGAEGTIWDNVCVGADHATAPGVLGGDYSFYCGVLPAESEDLCYTDRVNKEGYGNSWVVCIGKMFYGFPGGAVILDYDFVNETEGGFDFTRLEVDTLGDGSGVVEVLAYDGLVSGHETSTLVPGIELPSGPADSIQVRFCFVSDGAWADDDGLFPTVCGAFSVDNIALSGAIVDGPSTFEGGDPNGWELLPEKPGPGGEWSNLVDWSTVPAVSTCPCNLSGNVLVLEDLTTVGVSHNEFQDNLAGSPWIELQPGHDGPIRFVETDVFSQLPLRNFIFLQVNVKYYPDPCPFTGLDRESPWVSNGFVFFFDGVTTCTEPGENGFRVDFSSVVPPSATRMRIALGVISYCRFFATCTGLSNITPVFDNARLGVAGTAGAPFISTRTIDLPQDNFPANGTLRSDAPARMDAGNVVNEVSPEIFTDLGDTLLVQGATGGAEVHVEFQLVPGPGIDLNDLNAFYASVTPRGGGWYSARMDTAERGSSGAIDGSWMTAYHEDDPNFSGSDTDLDPTDTSGFRRLANDIFPDDLFTPGTRLNLFYRTRYLAGSAWFVHPDTSGASYIEWEALPSSMDEDDEWNCVLYVDHFDGRGAQATIENGLSAILGTGSANFEGTNWDRYDVRAPSSQQASFGRPLGTEYGANVVQALGYRTILWNSGNLSAFNLVKEDADILVPWLTLRDFTGNSLYLTGDGIAQSIKLSSATEPSSLTLLNDIIGADLACGTLRNEGCPSGTPEDASACISLDPVTGVVAGINRSFFHEAQGNGCPELRSFDVIVLGSPLFGASVSGDEEYDNSFVGGKTARWASVATDAAASGQPNYRVILDGVSVHYRRDTLLGPCSPLGDSSPVTERLAEVLTYLGGIPTALCEDPVLYVGTPGDMIRDGAKTSLANFSPNPLRAGGVGTIEFTMAREDHARVDIFDVQGGLVKTVFDGIAREGTNEAVWDATDVSGRNVSSGVYFYRLNAGADVSSRMMVVVGKGGKRP